MSMNRHFHLIVAALIGLAAPAQASQVLVGFDDLPLAPNTAFWGPMPNSTLVDGTYGKVAVGSFRSGGVDFGNRYDTTYGSWGGFAYSNQVNTTTAGYTNQFSAYAGEAHSGSNFGVAYGYRDVARFDPNNLAQLQGLPNYALPAGASIAGMYVTNTTYAALSMMNGDSIAKKFGAGDWFKLTAYGVVDGVVDSVEFYLADFRSSNAADRYILDEWAYMDLSSLAGAERLYFNLSSTDVGQYGMNTPGYFAMDDLTYTMAAVPEPASFVAAATAAGLLVLARGLRRRSA